MSARNWQEGNAVSFNDLVKRAKIETQKQKEKQEDYFMALRKNVRIKLRQLYFLVKPSEYYIAELICDGTVDWKHQYEDIDLIELAKNAGVRMDVLKSALKNLTKMGVIKRTPHPRLRYTETMCLNPEYFGQILIDRQSKADQSHLKRHLQLVQNNVVDNPKSSPKVHVEPSPTSCSVEPKTLAPDAINHVKHDVEPPEIIKEVVPSISPSYIPPYIHLLDPQKTGQNRSQSFTPSGGTDAEKAAVAKAYIHSLTGKLFGSMP